MLGYVRAFARCPRPKQKQKGREAMQRIGDILAETFAGIDQGQHPAAKRYFEALAAARADQKGIIEIEREKANRYNASKGDLDPNEYDCPLCLNRGHICYVEMRNGYPYVSYPECECMAVRRSLWRIRQSGLAASIKRCTFDTFKAGTDWQRRMKDRALEYCAVGAQTGAWLFIGGAVGCGKTHICTAVAGRLMMEKHMSLYYMTWPSESARLKAIINDDAEYAEAIGRIKNVEALYIDDFFKPVKDRDGIPQPPTGPDVRLAYEILNYRYVNRMPTLISSERYLSELEDIDMATSSRISERARGYSLTIGRDRDKNYRLTGDL